MSVINIETEFWSLRCLLVVSTDKAGVQEHTKYFR